jgi:hypothetical protein
MQKEVQENNSAKTEKLVNEAIQQLDNLTNNLQANKPEENARSFFKIAKSTFGKLFDIRHQYTYEELVNKLETIDRKLKSISFAIEQIKKNIDEVFTEEKDNPNLKEKVDQLEENLRKEYSKEHFYANLKTLLSRDNLKSMIKRLSHEISEMEYSDDPIKPEKLANSVDLFREIMQKIDVIEETEDFKKAGFFHRLMVAFGFRKEPKMPVQSKKEEPPKPPLPPKFDHKQESVVQPKLAEKPEKPESPEKKAEEKIHRIEKEIETSKPEDLPEKYPKLPERPKKPAKIDEKQKNFSEKQEIRKKPEKEPEKIPQKESKSDMVKLPEIHTGSQKPISKIPRKMSKLLDHTQRLIDRKDIINAKQYYMKALKYYSKLSAGQKEDLYRELRKLYHGIIHSELKIPR